MAATPRQITGMVAFAADGDRLEDARALGIGFSAARGETRAVKQRIKDLTKE